MPFCNFIDSEQQYNDNKNVEHFSVPVSEISKKPSGVWYRERAYPTQNWRNIQVKEFLKMACYVVVMEVVVGFGGWRKRRE